MKVLRLTVQEWYPFADIDVDLSRVSVASVVGRHASNPNRSNGAGKSYLLEAIPYALYGYTRDAKAVQRLGAEDDTFVELLFEHRGHTARVKRGFKRKQDGTPGNGFLEFDIDGEPQGTRMKELETEIVKFMGCDLNLYLSTSFFAQGNADQFARATPAQRKKILSELLNLHIYDVAKKIADTERKTIDSSIEGTRRQYEVALMSAEAAKRQIEEADEDGLKQQHAEQLVHIEALVALIADYEVSKIHMQSWSTDIGYVEREFRSSQLALAAAERRSRDTLAEVNRVTSDRDERHAFRAEEYRKRVEDIRGLPALEKTLTEIAGRIETLTKEREAYPPDDQGVKEWKAKEADANRRLGEAEVRARNASSSLVDLDAMGPQCPKCKRPLDEAHRASLHRAFTAAHTEAAADRRQAQADVEQAGSAIHHLWNQINARQRIDAELPALRERMTEIRERVWACKVAADNHDAAVESAKTEMATFDERIQQAKAAHEEAVREHEAAVLAQDAALEAYNAARAAIDEGAVQSLANLHARLVARLKVTRAAAQETLVALRAVDQARDRLAQHEERAGFFKAQIEGAEREIEVRQWLSDAFGKSGIPALIYENVVAEIEQGTVEILETLESPYRVRFQTETETGRDTLVIDVETPEGVRGLASFSGGQITELNLAIRLSLAEVLARRADVSFDSVYLDEVMAPLDETARQCVLSVVQLMRRSFSQVFVISHHSEIRDVLESCVLVEAHPDGSRVEVAA